MSDKQLYTSIDKLITILENNFRYKFGKKIPCDEVFEIMQDRYKV